MATYFKYAEREADSFINWAEIGKSMSDMLKTENQIREDKKAALDKASREFGEQLSTAPQGDHKGMNQWALEYASDAQQARLMQDQLLKSGQLKLRDYVVMRQNINDGTNQAFDLMKEYQSEYANKMERMKSEQAQDLEAWLMSEAEGFANFSNTKLYINPTDGTISVAKTVSGPDGVRSMSDNPNDFTTVNALRNRMKGHFDRFDVAANVGSYVDGLGEEISVLQDLKNKYRRGTITEVLDIAERTYFDEDKGAVISFKDAERKMLESMMANPYNTSSILTNGLNFDKKSGKEYTFTWSEDEAKANSNLILLKNDPKSGNPMPQFSEDQREAAFVYLRTQARLMYDKTEKTTVVGASESPRQQEWQYAAGQGRQQKEQLYQVWQDLYTGDEAKVKSATDAILGLPSSQEAGLVRITRDSAGVRFEYADSNKNRTISFTDANNQAKNPKDWFSSGTEVFGNITEKDRNKYGVGTFSGTDVISSSERAYRQQGPQADPIDIFNSATGQIDPSTFGKTEVDAATELQTVLAPLNIKVTPGEGYLSSSVIVTLPNGRSTSVETYRVGGNKSDSLKELMDFLETEMKAKPDVLKMASGGVGSKY